MAGAEKCAVMPAQGGRAGMPTVIHTATAATRLAGTHSTEAPGLARSADASNSG